MAPGESSISSRPSGSIQQVSTAVFRDRNNVNSREVKTSIEGLQVGMYVTRLDKPWIETPFALEGFLIRRPNDIQLLRRYAAFAFVDVERGPAPDPKYWTSVKLENLSLEGEPESLWTEPPKPPRKNEYDKLRKTFYQVQQDLSTELKAAEKIKARLEHDLRNAFSNLHANGTVDIDQLREGVKDSVGSILRNPSAMALLVELGKTDDYSYGHALSTSIWCAQFGRHLGLDRADIEALALGGLLLDVGKIKLPPELLNKPSEISLEESLQIQKHVVHSLEILKKSGDVDPKVMQMVATHHERHNGKGYPRGLAKAKIPMFGRIAGIVDSYDAMTTKRPYSQVTYTPNDAIVELYEMRDDSFQAELVEQFIQTVGLYPTGSLVELNTGKVAVVLEVNDLKRLYPTVMLLLDRDKKPLDDFKTVNLMEVPDGKRKVEKALPTGAHGINLNELFI